MDQQSIVFDIERRAQRAGVSIKAVCQRAKINPTTFSRWKITDRNPEPMGATLQSIGKLYAALDELERESTRRRRKVAA